MNNKFITLKPYFLIRGRLAELRKKATPLSTGSRPSPPSFGTKKSFSLSRYVIKDDLNHMLFHFIFTLCVLHGTFSVAKLF